MKCLIQYFVLGFLFFVNGMPAFGATEAFSLFAAKANVRQTNYQLKIAQKASSPRHLQASDISEIPDDYAEIGQGRYAAGGVVGTFIGLGTGHFIQGRGTGLFFLLAESATLTATVIGALNNSQELAVTGALSYIALRIFEIVDVWGGPIRKNGKVYATTPQWRLNIAPSLISKTLAPSLGFALKLN